MSQQAPIALNLLSLPSLSVSSHSRLASPLSRYRFLSGNEATFAAMSEGIHNVNARENNNTGGIDNGMGDVNMSPKETAGIVRFFCYSQTAQLTSTLRLDLYHNDQQVSGALRVTLCQPADLR